MHSIERLNRKYANMAMEPENFFGQVEKKADFMLVHGQEASFSKAWYNVLANIQLAYSSA